MRTFSGPVPAPAPRPDLDHPDDGKLLTLYNTCANGNNFSSFAYTDALEAEPKGSVSKTWLCKDYSSTDDAMPLRFDAAKGENNQYKVCTPLFKCPRIQTSRFPKYQIVSNHPCMFCSTCFIQNAK